MYLMRKLTLRHTLRGGVGKRLVVKSPIHTARIPLLRRLFPKAKFVYIHRHPFELFQSACRLADTAYWFCYMNTPTDDQIIEFIYWQFDQMWRKYAAAAYGTDGRLLPDILEISYLQLADRTRVVQTLERIYSFIGEVWGDDKIEHFQGQLSELVDYRPNTHTALSEATKREIMLRWDEYFDTFDYSRDI